MFTKISINSNSSEVESQKIDLNDILDKVNTVSFVERILPSISKELENDIEKSLPKKIENQNCHSITTILLEKYLNLEIVYGYLIIGKIPVNLNLNSPRFIVDSFANLIIEGLEKEGLDFKANTYRENAWVMKIDEENDRLMLKLLHHSVVRDENGNYIECIEDKYPLNSRDKYDYGYVFLPHTSAELLANESENSPCHIEISCSMHRVVR